jgi:hypothetical protein
MTTSSKEEIEKFRGVSAHNRKQGEDYEDYIERRLKLKRQRASGQGTIEKEDHVGRGPRPGEHIMVQTKSFSVATISFKVADLERLVRHARDCKVFEKMTLDDGTKLTEHVQDHREPVFIIALVDQLFDGPKDWVLVPLEEWEKYE